MTTFHERESQLEQLRERCFQTAVETMIAHLAQKLSRKVERLHASDQSLDETQWARFIHNLHPIEQQILIHHAGEIFQLMAELSGDIPARPQPGSQPDRAEKSHAKPHRRKQPQMHAD